MKTIVNCLVLKEEKEEEKEEERIYKLYI